MKSIFAFLIFMGQASANHGGPSASEALEYRNLTLRVRESATFKVPMPSGVDMTYSYQLKFAEPVYSQPILGDSHLDLDKPAEFSRDFFDRILLQDGSVLNIGNESLPLTCIFVKGQDNRKSGNLAPTFPQFIMRVYLVANDFSCQGPLRPGWPRGGGKADAWDTYVYYEVRDPTIMLPVEAHIRFRWNEFNSVLVK